MLEAVWVSSTESRELENVLVGGECVKHRITRTSTKSQERVIRDYHALCFGRVYVNLRGQSPTNSSNNRLRLVVLLYNDVVIQLGLMQ